MGGGGGGGGGVGPTFHKNILIDRHKDFIAYLMEELGGGGGVKKPMGVLYKIKDLGLNTKCVSDLTDREVTFLKILHTHYGLSKKKRYSARYPTRVVEVLYWRTLTEVFGYLKDAGKMIITSQ